MRAGHVTEGVDHRRNHEPEGECDTHGADATELGVDHDRATPDEDQRERSDCLSGEGPQVSPHRSQATAGSARPLRMDPTCSSAPLTSV